MNLRKYLPLLLLLTSCDSGDIVDSTYSDSGIGYVARLEARVSGLDKLPAGYKVSLAAFSNDNDISIGEVDITQGDISADGNVRVTYSGISSEATRLELCLENKLRRRIVTMASVEIENNHSVADTIRLTLADNIDLSTYSIIQDYVFDGPRYNCSACHGATGGRAGLSLAKGNSYENLMNVPSTRVAGGVRVVPGNPAGSVLYQALEEGNPTGLRYDHSAITDSYIVRLIGDWIKEEI